MYCFIVDLEDYISKFSYILPQYYWAGTNWAVHLQCKKTGSL